MRFTKGIQHFGPIISGKTQRYLSKNAVNEWMVLLDAEINSEEITPVETVPAQVAKVFAEMKAVGKFNDARYIAEIDYSINSAKHRLFIYDRKEKKLETHKVAHGSGGANKTPHNGECRQVSNVPQSNMSCLGLFRCAEVYDGPHGDAIRLDGLSTTNSMARMRGIVLHRSDYVFDNTTDISGRSLGCPAVDRTPADSIIDKLCNGSPLFSHHNGRVV